MASLYPDGWSARPLASFATPVDRRLMSAPQHVLMIASRSGFVPQSQKYSRPMAGQSLQRYIELREGEFAYNRGNSSAYPCGCVYRLEGYESAAVPFVYSCFSVDGGVADAAYLKQFFGAGGLNAQLQRMINSGVRNNGLLNIRAEAFFSCEVPLPPLAVQRKVAAILKSVDDAISATQAVIDKLQVVKTAVMAELLTRGPPGWHTNFRMTEIGGVPEAWQLVRLGDVCERMFVGVAQAATHAYVAEGGVPIIRTTNVRANRLQADDVLRINHAFALKVRSKALRSGDVLTARTGHPGTSVVVPREFDGAQCFSLLVSRPGPRLLAQFLCHLMNSAVGARIVARGKAGGAQQNLNVGVFGEAVIALPPAAEQAALVSMIDATYEREFLEQSYVTALRGLKSALLSALLTGNLRVLPDAPAP